MREAGRRECNREVEYATDGSGACHIAGTEPVTPSVLYARSATSYSVSMVGARAMRECRAGGPSGLLNSDWVPV
jgi:hypothetical protein